MNVRTYCEMLWSIAWSLAICSSVLAQSSTQIQRAQSLVRKLLPLSTPIAEPQPGDWLATQQETGQTFRQYLSGRPNTLSRRRSTLYIQPIGEFLGDDQALLEKTAEFLEIYFACKVRTLETIAESEIPSESRGTNTTTGKQQILTSYVLEKLLPPRLPRDGFAILGLTTVDLWPGEGWNFVFGQATYRDRVGIWSISRFESATDNAAIHDLRLRRTLKVASHETGHMFSIKHCTAYACNMQGSNSLEEADRQPLNLCPECLAKVVYATNTDAGERFVKLAEFCKANKIAEESYFQAAGEIMNH